MSNSGEESDIPDRETCQKLTEQFADITGTDEACAQFYLQDRKWDLQRSVNAFFESTQRGGVNLTSDGDEPEMVVNVDKNMVNTLKMGQATTEPPSNFSVISWNIDGLEDRNLKKRTKAVCKIIYSHMPDIVFLQEVIPETLNYIQDKLPEYMCIAGNVQGYFIATLLHRFTVYYDGHKIVPFPTSVMMRNMLVVEAHIGSLKLQLLNTHLESAAEHAAERVKQLGKMFEIVQDFPEEYAVICGGDLNLRDKELDLVGGIPPGLEDLWQACGARKECQFTWDMQRNTNKEMPGRFKPRCRFDRVYMRNSHPKKVTASHFGLVGIAKVINTQSFPSDHWGLHMLFDIEKN